MTSGNNVALAVPRHPIQSLLRPARGATILSPLHTTLLLIAISFPTIAVADNEGLTQRQAGVTERYQRLEELLLRLADMEAAENPERSALLKRAARQSRDKFVLEKLRTATDSLRTEEFQKAVQNQESATEELSALLTLLMSEDRSQRIRDEKERYQKLIKDLKRNLNNQRSARARTENDADLEDVQQEQKSVTERSQELKDRLSQDNAANQAAPSESEPGESEPGESQPSESQPSESQPSESQPSESQPSESKPGESEPSESEPSESEPSESKPGESEPGESEPGESEPGESEPGESKPGESENSDSSDPPENSDQPPQPSSPEQEVEQRLAAGDRKDAAGRTGTRAGPTPGGSRKSTSGRGESTGGDRSIGADFASAARRRNATRVSQIGIATPQDGGDANQSTRRHGRLGGDPDASTQSANRFKGRRSGI